MKYGALVVGGIGLGVVALLLGMPGRGFADDDEEGEEEEEHEGFEGWARGHRDENVSGVARRSGVAPVTDAAWREECGSCHLAYPPGLLPGRSWVELLRTLDHHFGDDASVAPATRDALMTYAVANSADVGGQDHALSAAIARATAGKVPLRISEISFLAHEHGEVRPSTAAKAGSFARCQACHTGAERGSFAEGEIVLPK